MHPKSLVLVVGAGASKEVNLPVGAELRSQIAHALDIRYEHGYNQISGARDINDAYRILARETNPGKENINPFLETSWRIRNAMQQAMSIDNFIDSHRKEERIAICGKLAIAKCILEAETRSAIFVNTQYRDHSIDFASIENTWYNTFFQLLTENCQEDEIDDRLAQVAIVSFNYDRCIAHYLHYALQNYFGITSERAAEALSNLQIYHPYGSVGPLPWQSHRDGVGFGHKTSGQNLIKISKGIKTFTEGVDPEHSSIIEIRRTLEQAKRIAFLGFAFHPLNLKLLFPGLSVGQELSERPVYATGHGISTSDSDVIKQDLNNLGAVFQHCIHFRNDLTCAKLLTEYRRSLSLLS